MNPDQLLQNFVLQDWLGSVLGVLIFGAVLLLPGGGLVWITNALDFRQQASRDRLAISLLAGLSVLPILVYWSARFAGFWLSWVMLGLLAMAGTWTYRNVRLSYDRQMLSLLGLAVLWAFMALFLLIDLQLGPDRLYPSWTYGDYALRVPFTTAITRDGLPPQNLSYSPGRQVALFYYYFWPLIGSLVDQIGGGLVSARSAVYAGTVWIGLGLVSAFYLVLFNSRRRFKLGGFAFLLLLVGGLDLLPLGIEAAITLMIDRTAVVRNAAIFLGTTGWNHGALVETWPNAVLWVPHHVAALLAGVFALLSLTQSLPAGRRAWLVSILAGLSLASAAGYSLWIALVLASTLLVYFVLCLLSVLRGQVRRKQLWILLVCGAVAGIAFLPFVLELTGASNLGGLPIALYVRSFDPVHRLLDAILPQADPFLVSGLDFLLLPLNFAIEFGFVALLAWIGWQRNQDPPSPLDILLRVLFWSSLLISTFLRSTVLNNDLAWRGILPAQFVLLVWAARSPAARFSFWSNPDYSRSLRLVWCLALLLGLAATTYDMFSIRAYSLLKERLEEPAFGGVYFSIRQARQAIETMLPPGAYVQASPAVAKNFHHGLYSTHPTLIADRYTLRNSLIPEGESSPLMDEILSAFAASTPRRAALLCQKYHLHSLLFSAWDPTWRHSPWQRSVPALFANDHTRLVACEDLNRWVTSP